MNKQMLTLISIVLAIVIAFAVVLVTVSKKMATSGIKTAQGLENSGRYDEAMSLYGAALIAKTESRTFPNIPDKTTAANLNPQTWQKPLAEFVDWLIIDKKPSSEVSSVITALGRCESKVIYKNYIFDIKMNKVSLDQYKMIWKRLFCPESVILSGLIEKAYSQSEVIVTLTGNSIYSYDADFVHRASAQRINVPVDLDKSPPLLLRSGSYFLILKSKTMFKHGFQAGKGWTSGTEAVSFSVPDSVNVITATLRTEVERKKEKNGGELNK
jgi:hypothetical protein